MRPGRVLDVLADVFFEKKTNVKSTNPGGNSPCHKPSRDRAMVCRQLVTKKGVLFLSCLLPLLGKSMEDVRFFAGFLEQIDKINGDFLMNFEMVKYGWLPGEAPPRLV